MVDVLGSAMPAESSATLPMPVGPTAVMLTDTATARVVIPHRPSIGKPQGESRSEKAPLGESRPSAGLRPVAAIVRCSARGIALAPAC